MIKSQSEWKKVQLLRRDQLVIKFLILIFGRVDTDAKLFRKQHLLGLYQSNCVCIFKIELHLVYYVDLDQIIIGWSGEVGRCEAQLKMSVKFIVL